MAEIFGKKRVLDRKRLGVRNVQRGARYAVLPQGAHEVRLESIQTQMHGKMLLTWLTTPPRLALMRNAVRFIRLA